MSDFKHFNGDQPFTDDDYELTEAAWPSMIREMESEYEEDEHPETGEIIRYGNRVHVLTDRGSDSDVQRELIKRYYTEVGERYEKTGQMEGLEVIVGDPLGLDGVGVVVKAFDVQAGLPQESNLKAWANG